MGAKAIKLGSWDKHPGICAMRGNVMEYFKPGE